MLENSPSFIRRWRLNVPIVLSLIIGLLISGYVVVAVVQKYVVNQGTAPSLIESQTFEVKKPTNSLTVEKASVTVRGQNWSLNSFGNFSNQSERDAEAQAAFSRQVLNSYQTALGLSRPDGVAISGWQVKAPLAPGNNYAGGNCTWYAYNRRFAIGKPIGTSWGNGGSWHYRAPSDGFSVDHNPQVGDVIDMPRHVAVVEAVGENDTVYISEMNINWVLYSYQERWVPNASSYWFIH